MQKAILKLFAFVSALSVSILRVDKIANKANPTVPHNLCLPHLFLLSSPSKSYDIASPRLKIGEKNMFPNKNKAKKNQNDDLVSSSATMSTQVSIRVQRRLQSNKESSLQSICQYSCPLYTSSFRS
jgi:hypothetical protein